MSKANDNIPADEMLLAEALAAAKARGLGWCQGKPFVYDDDYEIVACCAKGALSLAGLDSTHKSIDAAWIGNDSDEGLWGDNEDDFGRSLGWAFRCAMTESP